jgi:phage tail-like protein
MPDPYRQFRFKVKVGDFEGGFSEVTVAETTIDPIDYREGNEAPNFRKISGLTKYGNITLKRGTMDTLEFFNWIKGVHDTGSEGKDSRKSITITLLDESGKEKANWSVVNAWPTKYKPSDLNAKTNDIAIESIEFAHEGITRNA